MNTAQSIKSRVLAWITLLTTASFGQTAYNFGNPTAEEQYYIELINRARADPAGEGNRLATTTDPDVLSAYTSFGVNLSMLQTEFNALPANLPPLAPNASLTDAARGHSSWMLATAIQDHNETNPSNTPFTRMNAAGYVYSNAGENIFASAKSVWHAHAGFEVDWGTGTGGMQSGRGHRANIHSTSFKEIGVGVVLGTNQTVGPQLVTQDFGTQLSGATTFGTGVAYYDLNSNNFYDIGEGISGLTVDVSGVSTYNCVTAAGGGWAIPIPDTAATRTVTFSGLNVNQSTSVAYPGSTSVKTDLKLTYAPPVITSAASATAGTAHNLTFNSVAGATGYHWTYGTLSAAPAENCDSTANITAATTGSYSVLSTTVKQQGTGSFHLQNTTGNSQSIQLNGLYYGGSSPTLSFQSRVRYASTAEYFKVQIKEEGTTAWQDVYSQQGTNTSGESAFNSRSAALTGMTGKLFRVRFLLNFSTGSYYSTSGDIVGWFVDAINFTNASLLQNTASQNLASNTGSFTPSAGTYLMIVAPVISGKDFPPATQVLTAATVTTPVITTQPASVTIATGATATFSVAATGGSLSYQWYSGNSGATANPVSGATSSTFTTPALPSNASYWVKVSNSAGNADSATATATVIAPPAIICQPVSTTIQQNTETFTLAVHATGPSLSYQWYNGPAGVTASPISGATAGTYTTPTQSIAKTYWVRVTNPVGAVNSATSTISVSPTPVTRTFTTWAAELETANGLAAGTISSPNADADKDGRSNLVEYAFGGQPLVPNDAVPNMPVLQSSATDYLISYGKNTALTDITLAPQAASDLATWKAPGAPGAPAGFTDVLISTNGNIQMRQARIPKTTAGNWFLRIEVTQQ